MDVPEPNANQGEVSIAVRATALNRADLLQTRGKYPPPPGVTDVLGLECAGVLDRVGPNTSSAWLGRRVMTLLPGGGYSERVTVPERLVMPIPDALDFTEAAAIPEAFLTADQALFGRARLHPNERVLVTAAAGGVGCAAVQLARAEGAEVLGLVGSDEKRRFVEGLGARGVNYGDGDVEEQIRAWGSPDVIVDFVGASQWELYQRVLAIGGRVVVVGVLGGTKVQVDLSRLLRKRQAVLGMVMRSLSWSEKIAITQRFLRTRFSGFSDGRLRPVIDRTYPLDAARDAHEHMASNQNIGKIVLTV